MRVSRRRVLFALTGVAAAGWLGLLAWERSYRDPPNYSRVEDQLYLGGYVPEPPPGTTAVLNLCEQEDRYRREAHVWDPNPDAEPAPGLDWLRQKVEWVDANRAAGRTVFVHCRNGVSRSGMVVVAYVMWKQHLTRDEALAAVRARRPEVRPNPAFLALLAEWETTIHPRSGEK